MEVSSWAAGKLGVCGNAHTFCYFQASLRKQVSTPSKNSKPLQILPALVPAGPDCLQAWRNSGLTQPAPLDMMSAKPVSKGLNVGQSLVPALEGVPYTERP